MMPKSQISRRSVLTTAGAAVAAGVAVGAAPADAVAPTGVGVGAHGTTVEFRGRIAQSGPHGEAFTSYGFLTKANGAKGSDLFRGSSRTVSSALITVFASGELTARVLDMNVHALDIVGDLTVYQRRSPGADFAHPNSFKVGTPVATFALTLQDVLAVFAAGQGIPTLTGDMRQTDARMMSGGLSGKRFGFRGQRLRLFATGLGFLVDPVTLNANLEIAGNWSVE
jgi:hypothetical protein